jgi:ABC-type multidrug transport system ATPase subunit
LIHKTCPAGKKALDNVNPSFCPDAKIGVLCVNGLGKSTLVRIMAGVIIGIIGDTLLNPRTAPSAAFVVWAFLVAPRAPARRAGRGLSLALV